ncbi:MAG TPA: PfkB family carbohydrate kinase [Micromonosporaceae bacterium]|jgi:sugar/nucleoside kinase (ribokinase family)
MSARHVVVIGDIVTDVLAVLAAPLAPGSDTRARIRLNGGGQAANTAAWLAHAGAAVTLVGAVGADDAGAARLAELAASGVSCAVRRHPEATTGTVLVLARGQDRTMVTDRGANLLLKPSDVDSALAAAPGAAHLHLSAYALLDPASRPAGLRALAAARARGLTASVDAASAEPLRQAGRADFLEWVRGVDLLLANAAEAAVLAGAGDPAGQATRLTEWVGSAVVKLGADGALWAGPADAVVRLEAPAVSVVDPTGAGDAFAAGLLAAWVAGADRESALRAGVELGARAVAVLGARPGG